MEKTKDKLTQPKRISFDDIPEVLSILLDKVEKLNIMVSRIVSTDDEQEKTIWLNLPELIKYLPNHPAQQTIYSWTSSHKIPYHKKGSRILFNKKEIDNWLLESDYHKSESELEREALEFVNNKLRRR